MAENPTGQCVRHISAPHGIHVSSGGASLPPSSQMWHPTSRPPLALPSALPALSTGALDSLWTASTWAPRERPTRAHTPSPISQSQGVTRWTGGQRPLPERPWYGIVYPPSSTHLSVWPCSTETGVSCSAETRPPAQWPLELVRPPDEAMVMGLRGPGGRTHVET